MKLIVGLGNPGKKYSLTRHNLGFMVLDALVNHFTFNKKFKAEISKQGEVIFAKPQIFMNLSGQVVKKIAQYYKIKPEEILIIHDDKDLPFGKIRLRHQGSSGGHLGVQSIIDALRTNKFNRLKIGIGNVGTPRRGVPTRGVSTSDFVLEKFSPQEKKELTKIIRKVLVFLQQ